MRMGRNSEAVGVVMLGIDAERLLDDDVVMVVGIAVSSRKYGVRKFQVDLAVVASSSEQKRQKAVKKEQISMKQSGQPPAMLQRSVFEATVR